MTATQEPATNQRLDTTIKVAGGVLLAVAAVIAAAITGLTVLGSDLVSVSPSGLATLVFTLTLVVLLVAVQRTTARTRRSG